MYMPYLMYGYASILLLMLLGCWVMSRTTPRLRGMGLLGWSFGSAAFGIVLLSVRLFTPPWATIVLANEVVFVALLLMYCATASILNVRARFLPWAVAQLVVGFAAIVYYTYFDPSLIARIFVSSGSFGLYAVAQAVLLFRYTDASPDRRTAAAPHTLIVAVAWLQILVVATHLVRCALTLLYRPTDVVHMDLIQAGFTYLNLLLNAGTGCGLTWLSLSMHRLELQQMANTDGLTGLLNRRAFEEILTREMYRACRRKKSLAVLLVDIDRFKQVNDAWGHHAGDEVLRRVSAALREGIRPSDAVCRYGGEEFAALLRDASLAQSEEIAGRLRAEIASLKDLPGETQLTVSIGVAASRTEDTLDNLLRRCDDALYRSKRGGRNLVTVDGATAGDSTAIAPASA